MRAHRLGVHPIGDLAHRELEEGEVAMMTVESHLANRDFDCERFAEIRIAFLLFAARATSRSPTQCPSAFFPHKSAPR